MSRKLFCSVVLFVVLIGVLGVLTNVHKVEARYPIIRIKVDGSIDPQTANITRSDNVTYTFRSDINASIDVEKDNIVIDGDGYTLQGPGTYGTGINLTERINVTVKSLKIKAFEWGVYLLESSNNTISGNKITENSDGVLLDGYSNNNTISGNNITDNSDGILLDDSSNNNSISGNIITNKLEGIWLDNSLDNNVYGNKITNNPYGIVLVGSSNNNSVSGNRITNNVYAIWLEDSSDNEFYHNNFVNNTQQVHIETSGYANSWDNDIEGNYWSDYTGVDLEHDGIGDSWYNITQNNIDHCPLMGPFHSFNTTLGKHVNVISNSTVEDFEYFESNSTIIMHVSNMTSDQTCGFCRIRIPHALMNETYHVTINGAEPHYINYTLYDDEENRWIYFSYQHSTLEIVIIPEFPSFLILPLFMTATLIVVIIYKRKRARPSFFYS